MATSLSLVNLIWIIAAGVLIFSLLFLFAKRQIMRFTLKARRGPYVSIGSDAPKALRLEINRRLNRVEDIKYEPLLLNSTMEEISRSGPNHFYYRMKAVDAFVKFDETLRKEVPAACRHPKTSMRDYLTTIYPEYLSTLPTDTVTHFTDLYEHARHRPEVFDESHYITYINLLEEMIICLEDGIKLKKEATRQQMNTIPTVDTEVTLKSHNRGIGITKTSIPYNHMAPSDKYSRGQNRYRTRASSSEQAGLLESATSSQRSSVEALVTNASSLEEHIQLVDMRPMPTA